MTTLLRIGRELTFRSGNDFLRLSIKSVDIYFGQVIWWFYWLLGFAFFANTIFAAGFVDFIANPGSFWAVGTNEGTLETKSGRSFRHAAF